MNVNTLGTAQMDEAVDVLCDAFGDYPVMRFVIGQVDDSYAVRLRSLVAFFTAARFLNGDLVWGVRDKSGELAAVANITPPGERPRSAELDVRREALWRELGEPARERYESVGRIWQRFVLERPHYHLNMIGVRRSFQGHGAARLLLDALHERSANAADSCGVSLSTEVPVNVRLYEHFGYQVTGYARVSSDLETWGFFRPNPAQ